MKQAFEDYKREVRDGAYPAESIVSIHNLGGVIGVSLVYEYSDEESGSETEEAMS